MAALTKGQIRTAVRQQIDDPGAARWSDANLDILITVVQDAIWQQILDSFPDYLTVEETETTSAAGKVALSALTGGRFYRIQRILNPSNIPLHPILFNEAVPQGAYYILGGNIVTVPVVNAANVTINYSYLPTRFNDLANDNTAVTDWPEGHEGALIFTSAAIALTKGDAESMNQLAVIANAMLDSMVTHIARRYPVVASVRQPSITFQMIKGLVGEQAAA